MKIFLFSWQEKGTENKIVLCHPQYFTSFFFINIIQNFPQNILFLKC